MTLAHVEQVVRKAMVSSVDEAVGNLIQTLEATGAVQEYWPIVNGVEWQQGKLQFY